MERWPGHRTVCWTVAMLFREPTSIFWTILNSKKSEDHITRAQIIYQTISDRGTVAEFHYFQKYSNTSIDPQLLFYVTEANFRYGFDNQDNLTLDCSVNGLQ